jgi:peptidoglycan/xylan/chitin deacetylase (PgdA/CDA1 family)
MKKSVLAICITLVISLVFGGVISKAADKQPTRLVGIHDRLLDFKDIRVIDGDTKVPLSEIAKYMYISMETADDAIHLRNQGFEVTYDIKTKRTLKNGINVNWSPIVKVDDKYFGSVKYIASEFGFNVEYYKKLKTLRIYRDNYVHMSHEAYEIHVKQLLDKKSAVKPPAKPRVVKPPVKVQTKPTPAKPGAKSKTNVYLTFDDGPNKFTALNNATLKKYNAKGTFFFLGKNMKTNEATVKAVAKNGHYIGTHSMTHDKRKVYKTPKSFIDEMNEGTKLINKMTGKNAKLLRVPYGTKPHVTPAMQKKLNQKGYKVWDWDVDSNDWKYTDKQTNEIIKNVRTGVEKANKAGDRDIIILMHDRSQTSKALPKIIEWLQKEGYTIKTYEPEHHIIQNFLRDTTL